MTNLTRASQPPLKQPSRSDFNLGLGILIMLFFCCGAAFPAARKTNMEPGPHLMPPHPRLGVAGQLLAGQGGFPDGVIPPGFNGAAEAPQALTGSIKALAVLVNFSDRANTVTAAAFDTLIFAAPAAGIGSVRDYFSEISYGTIDIVSVDLPSSLGWISVPGTQASYVNANNCIYGAYPGNCQKLAEDVVDAVDALVDFSEYDNDGNGAAEPLMLIHAGPGAEFTGSKNDVWSHSWNLRYPRSLDGVSVREYVIMPEYWQNVSASTTDMTIGVFAHEMGHGFWGLPDLYDYDGSSWGIGSWSLMAGGSWNGPSGRGASPAWPDAWSRLQMGIAGLRVIDADTPGLAMPAASGSPPPVDTVFKITNPSLGLREFFLLENRQKVSGTYDYYLPGSGLLIWHIDESRWNYSYNNNYECEANPDWGCDDIYHPLVQLEQADGLDNLEAKTSRGDAGDIFPGSTDAHAFGTDTNPESSSYYGSGASKIEVNKISAPADVMTADIIMGRNLVYLPGLIHNAGVEEGGPVPRFWKER